MRFLNHLSIFCSVSLCLVSCGGGNGIFTNSSSSAVTKSTFAFDANNNVYLSDNGTSYSKVSTTGFPTGTNFTTQAGSNVAATVGSDGYIAVSSNLQSWAPATSPKNSMANGLTLSLALYNVIMAQEKSSSSNSLRNSSNPQPTIIVAVGQSGNIQVVKSSSSSMSLSQAVKEHKLQYRQILSVTNNDLYSIAEDQNTGNLVGVGTNNTGIISTDMGNTFTSFSLPTATSTTPDNYFDVEALKQKLFAVGSDGMVQISSDGGKTWNPQNSGISDPLLTVKSGTKNVVAAGLNSTIIYSPDEGTTWKKSLLPAQWRNGAVNVRDISVSINDQGKEIMTAFCVPTSASSSKLSARDVFLRKHSLNATQSQVIFTSNDDGVTWNTQNITSNTASSSSIGNIQLALSTIQNLFNNPIINPDNSLSKIVTSLANKALSFLIGG